MFFAIVILTPPCTRKNIYWLLLFSLYLCSSTDFNPSQTQMRIPYHEDEAGTRVLTSGGMIAIGLVFISAGLWAGSSTMPLEMR